MIDDLQSLEVVERLFPLILSGEKTSTIRWNETIIVLGPMRYICRDKQNQTIIVNVLRCSDMPLSEVAKYLGQTKKWSALILLKGMREHYPKIELSDSVQVIEHSPPKKFIVPGSRLGY